MSIGSILREKREERKLSVADVFAETKINKKYIQALEDDNFLLIPSQVYAKGFLKAYSIFLGLDSKSLVGELMNYYKNREGDRKAASSAKKLPKMITLPGVPQLPKIIGVPKLPKLPNVKGIPRPNFKIRVNMKIVYISGLIVLILLFLCVLMYGYILFHKKAAVSIMANPPATVETKAPAKKATKPKAPAAKAPAAKSPAAKAPAKKAAAVIEKKVMTDNSIPEGKIELKIDTIGRSWIYVISGTKVLYDETLNPGAKLRFVGREITVKTGNGGGVKVYVNGISKGLMGKEGVAAEKTYKAEE
jgi:transcriptional regulator with XRE-family HTH domain